MQRLFDQGLPDPIHPIKLQPDPTHECMSQAQIEIFDTKSKKPDLIQKLYIKKTQPDLTTCRTGLGPKNPNQ